MKIRPVGAKLYHADGQTLYRIASAVLEAHLKILRSAHTVCLCVLCGSENKRQLFPCTTLTDWFV
jgi:hypothetical protein